MATLIVLKNDDICQAAVTVTFTNTLGLILSSGGEVLFKIGSTVVYQYSDTLLYTDATEVPADVATVTVTDYSVSVTIIDFDVWYKGTWSSSVVGSTNSDVESNSLDVVITSAACQSKRKMC